MAVWGATRQRNSGNDFLKRIGGIAISLERNNPLDAARLAMGEAPDSVFADSQIIPAPATGGGMGSGTGASGAAPKQPTTILSGATRQGTNNSRATRKKRTLLGG